MRRTIKTAIALLCALVMLVPICAFGADGLEAPNMPPDENLTPSGESSVSGADGMEAPSEPPGGSTETTETHEYSYIEFGSYPQTEIVSQASDCGVYGKVWGTESDYIIDADLYNTLKTLSEDQWDANGDAAVGGNKYRRIKEDDATGSKSDEGSYYTWSSADTYHYFKYEPIVWRILEQNDGEAFLLSETVLDAQMYNTNITGEVTWETSTIRSWLNGYDSSKNEYGTDYSGNNFINTAFTSDEQARIKTTTLENKDNIEAGTEGGNDTRDKIYLLSEDEVYGSNVTGYGFASNYDTNDTARQAQSSTYAKAMGAESNDLGSCFWWLRSPGSHPGLFVLIRESGSVFRGGQHANSKSRGVRPALRIVYDGGSTDENSHITGDVTGNGEIDIFDLVHLMRYISGEDIEIVLSAADTNGDGEKDLLDLVHLMKYLAGVEENRMP